MSNGFRQSVLFESIAEKPVVVKFDQPNQSSDGGAILLKAVDDQMGLSEALTEGLQDRRQAGKVDHELPVLLRQRIYGIVCGYFDGNDAAKVGRDPAMKLACQGKASGEQGLASQPTVSRFENAWTRTDLMRAGYALARTVLASLKERRRGRPVRQITIDLDPVCDPTYGEQQLTFFNGYYDTWCYLPTVVTVQLDQESDKYLVGVLLRAGDRSRNAHDGVALLRRVLALVREAFGRVSVTVRMDSEFAAPEMFEYLEAQERLVYYVAIASNAVLKRLAAPLMAKAKAKAQKKGQTQRRYRAVRYAAESWKQKRRVVVKAEYLIYPGRFPKENYRFVVTNAKGSARRAYETYCGRGDHENKLDELKNQLRMDLTRCTKFLANQFRCLLTASAYALSQSLRHKAQGTSLEKAEVQTLRERILKVAAVVIQTVRRIWVRLPENFPWAFEWTRIALRCTAQTG
jgi:hypothetical protein